MMENTIDEYIAERDQAIKTVDLEWAKANLPFGSDPYAIEIALHKVRYRLTTLPRELRHESAAWLRARGFRDIGGGELLPEGELPE